MSHHPASELHILPEGSDSSSDSAEADWQALRSRVLAALEEDPVNTAVLTRHMDHRGQPPADPAERVLAALIGLSPGPADARRLLETALQARQRWSTDHSRPVPLRLALLDLLLAENRTRSEPRQAELHFSAGLTTTTVADPAQAATSMSAITGAVQTELRRAQRFDQNCAVLRLGLDAWSELTWRCGRTAAEKVLAGVALVVKNEIRDVDWTARTPDNDLLVFLADTGRFGAMLVANRMLAKLDGRALPLEPGQDQQGISLGLAGFPEDARFGADLLQVAGNAMLRARAAGGGICDQGLPPRRRFVRVAPGSVRVVVRVLSGLDEDAVPEDCDQGLIFTSSVPYTVGSGVDLDCLEITGPGRAQVRGRVVRLEENPSGQGYDVGVSCRLNPDSDLLVHGGAGRRSDQ